MKIKVKLFGSLADVVGSTELTIEDVHDSEELCKQFRQSYEAAKDINMLVAVNRSIHSETYVFRDTDEIALLPPFSGG